MADHEPTGRPAERTVAVFGYRAPGRLAIYLLLPVFGVASVALFVGALTRGEPPLWFAAVWVAVAAWNAYWFTWHVGYAVEVHGDYLSWRTVLRSRTVALANVTGVSRFWVGWQRITVRDAPSMLIAGSGRGWVRFLAQARAATGRDDLQPSRLERAVAWLPDLTDSYYEKGH